MFIREYLMITLDTTITEHSCALVSAQIVSMAVHLVNRRGAMVAPTLLPAGR